MTKTIFIIDNKCLMWYDHKLSSDAYRSQINTTLVFVEFNKVLLKINKLTNKMLN